MNRRSFLWFAASLILFVTLSGTGFAGKGGGKGGGGGGGGGEDPPTLPDGLNVRYRVKYILRDCDAYPRGINDKYEVVGSYAADNGLTKTGFYYDASNNRFWSADYMIPIPDTWSGISFWEINNHGEIVATVAFADGSPSLGLVVYPTETTETGFDYEIIPAPAGNVKYWPRSINDNGDILGDFRSLTQEGEDPPPFEAFAYDGTTHESFPIGINVSQRQVKVTNEGFGLIRGELGWVWYDFDTGQNIPVGIPIDWQIVNGSYKSILSQDGQFLAYKETQVKKRSTVETPAVFLVNPGGSSDTLLWQGSDVNGRPLLVNSKVPGNSVGDILGQSTSSPYKWLRYADHPEWGYIDISQMLLFDSQADADLWSELLDSGWNALGPTFDDMSDRDSTTKFGAITGYLNSPNGGTYTFVLIPEAVTAP